MKPPNKKTNKTTDTTPCPVPVPPSVSIPPSERKVDEKSPKVRKAKSTKGSRKQKKDNEDLMAEIGDEALARAAAITKEKIKPVDKPNLDI